MLLTDENFHKDKIREKNIKRISRRGGGGFCVGILLRTIRGVLISMCYGKRSAFWERKEGRSRGSWNTTDVEIRSAPLESAWQPLSYATSNFCKTNNI